MTRAKGLLNNAASKLFVKFTRVIMVEIIKEVKNMKNEVIVLPRSRAIEVRDEMIEQLLNPALTKEETESLTSKLEALTKALEAENHAIEARTHAIEANKRGREVPKIVIGAACQGALLGFVMLFEKYSDHFLPAIARAFTPSWKPKM